MAYASWLIRTTSCPLAGPDLPYGTLVFSSVYDLTGPRSRTLCFRDKRVTVRPTGRLCPKQLREISVKFAFQ